ncbi:MAG TPA: replicative DNA helicase [Longimicrobium sp.]|jgi:replicative DNA helicase|uniref:replicative DNA helicase n=1 Tax=Longimicrobium sp. TaxID=2029185 RepID=UPI002ED95B7D
MSTIPFVPKVASAPPAFADRSPPYSAEAELAVLGGMLIDADALTKAIEQVDDTMFYREGNRRAFRAMQRIFERGDVVDALTLAEDLRNHGDLEAVGGLQFIASMMDAVPTAANIEYHARIVREKALLRRLIEAATTIIQDTYENPGEVDQLLDQAEQKIFEVAQTNDRKGFVWIKEILWPTFEKIEALQNNNSSVTGIPTGFGDLDEMTAGFQPSDLIIVAARPSMGKTAFTLNIAQHAAISAKKPVAFFSLEMSKESLVQRVLCAEARVDASRLRRGRLLDDEYARLATAAGYLNTAPIYIDDTAGISVLEMRAKARRLKADRPDLSMIIVDYLQLMVGGKGNKTENRQQEVSEISRGLKALAKELDLPVVALSQLSRAVESRPDKRPMMSDLRECVTGDTRVVLADGRRVPVRDLVGTTPDVIAVSEDGKLHPAATDLVWSKGRKPVFTVQLASGRRIRATAEHRLRGPAGWMHVRDMAPGDLIAVARETSISPERLFSSQPPVQHPPESGQGVGHEYGEALAAADVSSAVGVCEWPDSDLFFDPVVSVDPAGEEEVFDLTVPGPSCWLADGIVSHNSGAIEQDADVIMFLFRPEYYFGPTDKEGNSLEGRAELIIGKQRNGATGTVNLMFLKEFTRFESFSGRADGPPEY